MAASGPRRNSRSGRRGRSDLAKLIPADAGVRHIDDCKAKLGHELSDCLWSIIVLAHKYGIDLQAEFVRNTTELTEYVSRELGADAGAA